MYLTEENLLAYLTRKTTSSNQHQYYINIEFSNDNSNYSILSSEIESYNSENGLVTIHCMVESSGDHTDPLHFHEILFESFPEEAEEIDVLIQVYNSTTEELLFSTTTTVSAESVIQEEDEDDSRPGGDMRKQGKPQ